MFADKDVLPQPDKDPMSDTAALAAEKTATHAGQVTQGSGAASLLFFGLTKQELGILIGALGVILPLLVQMWFSHKRLKLMARRVRGEEEEREEREARKEAEREAREARKEAREARGEDNQ